MYTPVCLPAYFSYVRDMIVTMNASSGNLNLKYQTNLFRGFCFIVFKEVSALEAAVANEAHVVKVCICMAC